MKNKKFSRLVKSLLDNRNQPEKKKSINVDGWANILTGLGIAGRDKAASGIFRSCYNFNFNEYDQLYRSDGLTKRIIDLVASEMLRQGWQIEGDTDSKIYQYLEKIDAITALTDTIKWSRLYGGSICVMGIADGLPLCDPVDELNIDSIKWMRVFDRYQAQPNLTYMCCDLNSCYYGYPEIYDVNDFKTGHSFQVHCSRVLRMDWNALPPRQQNWNQGWGDSVINSIYEEIRNYGTSFANMSSILQDFINGVLVMPGLSDALNQDCGDSNIIKRLNFAAISKSNTNLMALDGEESFQKVSSNVAGLSDLVDRFMLAVCTVTGIPATLLFGRSPAGFNATGESDIRNYYDMVKNLQESKLKPCLNKLIRYVMLSKKGPFSGVELEDWKVEFNPLWQNTEEQEATIRRIVADTDAIYIDRGVLDPIEVAESRFGGNAWSMNTIIDIRARKNGYSEEELEDLEYQKAKESDTDVSVGPDALSQESSNIVFV